MQFRRALLLTCAAALISAVCIGCAKKAAAPDEPIVPDPPVVPDAPTVPDGATDDEATAPDEAAVETPIVDVSPVETAPKHEAGVAETPIAEPIDDPPSPDVPDEPPIDEPIPPGGRSDYSDASAPKTVASEEITSFRCHVALLSLEPDAEHPYPWSAHYVLSADRDGDRVACRVLGDGETTFFAEPAFLDELQKIVKTYDLAQFNGELYETHGLPDDFGATLRVDYASGEFISASNNQEMFLPSAAVDALIALFTSHA